MKSHTTNRYFLKLFLAISLIFNTIPRFAFAGFGENDSGYSGLGFGSNDGSDGRPSINDSDDVLNGGERAQAVSDAKKAAAAAEAAAAAKNNATGGIDPKGMAAQIAQATPMSEWTPKGKIGSNSILTAGTIAIGAEATMLAEPVAMADFLTAMRAFAWGFLASPLGAATIAVVGFLYPKNSILPEEQELLELNLDVSAMAKDKGKTNVRHTWLEGFTDAQVEGIIEDKSGRWTKEQKLAAKQEQKGRGTRHKGGCIIPISTHSYC